MASSTLPIPDVLPKLPNSNSSIGIMKQPWSENLALVIPPIAKELAGGMSEAEALKIVKRLKVTKTPILQSHHHHQQQQQQQLNHHHHHHQEIQQEAGWSEADLKRKELLWYFKNTWDITEMLFQVLKPQAFYIRADRLRHPLIFYYGHVAGFYVNKLRLAKLMKARVNKTFEALFAVGVDEMSWDDLLPDSFQWPTIEEVAKFRAEVKARVEQVIMDKENEFKLPIDWENPFWAVVMGCEHERIHLETSSVLIRQLPLSVLRGDVESVRRFWNVCDSIDTKSAPDNELLPVLTEPAVRTIGKAYNDRLYGWDNEYGRHDHTVQPFKASKFLVSHLEYLGFIQDGGYTKDKLWTEEGWNWVKFRKPRHPLFWIEVVEMPLITTAEEDKDSVVVRVNATTFEVREVDAGEHSAIFQRVAAKSAPTQKYLRSFSPRGYYYLLPSSNMSESLLQDKFLFRNMISLSALPWNWPVEVNNLEAKAFTNYLTAKTGKRIRLPTEEEYYVLNSQIAEDQPDWNKAPGNINLEHFCSSSPIDLFPPTQAGFYDVIGNVWQHTETPIDAYQGFRVHPIYEDFSLPTFDLNHNLMKGGSWISTGNEAIKDSRYAFRRHFFQHCGIRYVETDAPVVIRTDLYEQDVVLGVYSDFHFGPEHFGVPNFPTAVANFALKFFSDAASPRTAGNALDLGCAVGRTSFELARVFNKVCGLDFSARFIRSAVALKENKKLEYVVASEGKTTEHRNVSWEDVKLTQEVVERTSFYQSDACNLDPRYSKYDLIVCTNVLEFMYDPTTFLKMIHERLNEKGILILGSTYNWKVEFTPMELWLSGTDENPTADKAIEKILSPHFKRLEDEAEVPFVLRHSKRVYGQCISHLTVWEKK